MGEAVREPAEPSEWAEFLATRPGFERALRQFMVLHDAADVLDELKPPHGDTAAGFLREVGNDAIRDTGVPEDFLQAMIANKPPMPTAGR